MPSESSAADRAARSAADPFVCTEILGVRVDVVSARDLELRILDTIARGDRGRMTYANIHTVNLAASDPFMRGFVNDSDWVYCDGHGLKLGAALLDEPLGECFTAPEWLLNWGQTSGRTLRLFLLGSKAEVALRASEALNECPGFEVMGSHHGYFDAESASADNAAIVEAVNSSGAEMLLVGMGAPRQERWIAEHQAQLEVPIIFAVGAAFDYLAGIRRRPPRWMTRSGLEWLGRLWAEPLRLWRRYLIGIPRFFICILGEAVRRA